MTLQKKFKKIFDLKTFFSFINDKKVVCNFFSEEMFVCILTVIVKDKKMKSKKANYIHQRSTIVTNINKEFML